MRALIAGARGETVDAEPVIRAIAATLQSNSLDPGVQGRGDPAAERKPDRRPDGRWSIPTRSTNRARALRQAIGIGAARRAARGAPQRRRCRRRSVADAPRASGGCERSRSACSPQPTKPRRPRSPRRSSTRADNMTDRQGALGVLVSLEAPERQAALDAFYERFHDDALVLDKWFALQAAAQRRDTVDQVLRLAGHPDFTMTNPNRLRSLVGHVRRQPLGVPFGRRPRLRLPRRHDHRRRQAQSADRGAAGSAVRPLAAVRAASARR